MLLGLTTVNEILMGMTNSSTTSLIVLLLTLSHFFSALTTYAYNSGLFDCPQVTLFLPYLDHIISELKTAPFKYEAMVSVPYESYRCVELKLEDAETENAAPRKENRDLKGQLNTAKEMRKASDEHVKELESAQDNLKNSHGADYERIRGYLRSIDKVFEV